MATIALISCTKSKQSYRCQAKEMYSAKSPWFPKAYSFARLAADKIYFLSAKHNLLPENELIDPYDETLSEKNQQERQQWGDRVVHDLKKVADIVVDDFVIIAGRDYYEHLIPHIKHYWLPLRGKRLTEWAPELDKILRLEKTENDAEALHLLFNDLPRYRWRMINEVPFTNGIYVMFEKGEYYKDRDRIVRVGTHRSSNRLRGRLADHFIKEDSNGSIFRKNIGRVLLNKSSRSYLKTWEIDTRSIINREKYGHLVDENLEKRLEERISQYLRENISFVCFPVSEPFERMRLEEGIIATLNSDPVFSSSDIWIGGSSPISEIRNSGLWNREGLYGTPLTKNEINRIKWLCRFGSNAGRIKDSNKNKKAGQASPDKDINSAELRIDSDRSNMTEQHVADKAISFANINNFKCIESATLHTVSGKPFTVDSLDFGQTITVTPLSTGKPRTINWIELERAFQRFKETNILTVKDIRSCGASEANPAYVFAILAQVLDNVRVEKNFLLFGLRKTE